MAQAVEQYTPLDKERWTLNQAFDYLTVTLGYSEGRALHEMERERLAGNLAVKVHKVVDGKPQGDSEYLLPDKKHELVRHLGWVVPRNHKCGDNRWTVYKQRVLELWRRRLPEPVKPVEKYKRNTTDDDLVVEGVNGIRSGKWPNSLQAAEALAGRAKGSSHDSKVTRLRKKIGAALED